MSRYNASPSPSDALYQAPHRHSGRKAHLRGQRDLDEEEDSGSDPRGNGGIGGHDGGAWDDAPHSCSASPKRIAASQPLPMRMSSSRPRSRSRSLVMRQQHRRWPEPPGGIPLPPSPPLLDDDAAESGHRCQRSRRRRDGSSRSHNQRALRERDRDRQQRRLPTRGRGRNYARKLAASQAPMHMAMGMMHPLQLAMMQQMGMVPPAYLAAMQRPPGAAQALSGSMLFDGPFGDRFRRRRHASRGQEGASSSSSSESSDSESSGDENGVMHPAAAMAAMAAMWPGAAAAAAGGVEPGGGPNIEAFLAACPVDPEAADRLRALPPQLQQSVMRRGPLSETRNPSAVLIARVRDVELPPPPTDFDRSAASDEKGPKPARRSAKVTIEAMIRDYRLSPGCAWMLRALPPDKQKLAARIDPAGQSDPSGYVAEQLKRIV
mmetsp:Transcript_100494/g.199583  ORF Transcript_100494/g.199583 Transcript_100494/m.199583 type:complete len:434 (+) Transcript_100494:121-1422(+)